jgi:hypothetical protein
MKKESLVASENGQKMKKKKKKKHSECGGAGFFLLAKFHQKWKLKIRKSKMKCTYVEGFNCQK